MPTHNRAPQGGGRGRHHWRIDQGLARHPAQPRQCSWTSSSAPGRGAAARGHLPVGWWDSSYVSQARPENIFLLKTSRTCLSDLANCSAIHTCPSFSGRGTYRRKLWKRDASGSIRFNHQQIAVTPTFDPTPSLLPHSNEAIRGRIPVGEPLEPSALRADKPNRYLGRK